MQAILRLEEDFGPIARESSRYKNMPAQPTSLRFLVDAKPLYFLPNDNLAEEVLIPGFQTAAKVDCMVGFFSSSVLASLAPGLATYINCSENSFRRIICPILRRSSVLTKASELPHPIQL